MKLYLGADISQAFWRFVYPSARKLDWPAPAFSEEPCAYLSGDVLRRVPAWTKACRQRGYSRVDVLVRENSQRRETKAYSGKAWTGNIPEGSFYELADETLVSSPCFTFLQLASRLALPELIAYGTELCGAYAFDPLSPRGMVQRGTPLVNVADMKRYLDSAQGCRGVKAALRALPFIAERSASPMETIDEMLMCLPYRYGGYGVSAAEMNCEIPLSASAARIAGKASCKGDLCWLSLGLIIEHQGLFDHDNPKAFSEDRARIDALKTDGFNILELTTNLVHDLRAFEEIALYVAAAQGKRIRSEYKGATAKRLALRKCLFDWNRRNGRARDSR